MLKIECRRDLRHQYLVIHPQTDTDFGYRAKMILNNQLENFARCFSEELNGRMIFYHEIPAGYCALSAYLEQNSASENLYRKLMLSFSAALSELAEYLLEPAEILLEPEYVFLDEREMLFLFVYYPQAELSFAQKCIGFSEALLHRINSEERSAVEIGYLFYRCCVKEYITAERLNDMARSPLPDASWSSSRPKENAQASVQKTAVTEREPETEENDSFLFEQPEKKREKKKRLSGLRGLFGKREKKSGNRKEKIRKPDQKRDPAEEEELFPTDEEPVFFPEPEEDPELETVLLKPAKKTARAWLIAKDVQGSEKIPLEKDQILVGKSVAGADIFLDSAAVSRIHARISWETDAYGIADLGSKNGTTINGIPIRPGEWIRLKEGDEIGIADRCFTYCPKGK